MITADTISDEQIVELRKQHGHVEINNCGWSWPPRATNGATVGDLCASALNEIGMRHAVGEYGDCAHWCAACRNQRSARERLAEILNSRKAVQP